MKKPLPGNHKIQTFMTHHGQNTRISQNFKNGIINTFLPLTVMNKVTKELTGSMFWHGKEIDVCSNISMQRTQVTAESYLHQDGSRRTQSQDSSCFAKKITGHPLTSHYLVQGYNRAGEGVEIIE